MIKTLETLKKIFSEVLLSPEHTININKPYVEMGVDSILAIQIAKLIKLKLNYDLQPSELYNFTSIQSLAEYLAQKTYIAEDVVEHKIQEIDTTLSSHSTIKISDPIVIVGISGRFPGAINVWEYGDQLCRSQCFISDSSTRWKNTPQYHWKAGFLDDIDKFDANFFNISPREALMTDPQQRLMLEESFHAFEDAGLTLDILNNSNTAIVTTALPGDYKALLHSHKDLYSSYSFTGNAFSTLSGRLSHFFNLKGPSLSIDTACSSSLVAIDVACNYLKNDQCDFALVGAASIFSTPELFQLAQSSNLLSKTGKCSTFDEMADGFIPAESVCCIVLTTLSTAQKYQQQIYAVVEGIGVNHDGFTNGIMSPNSYSQKELIISTYQRYQINPADVGYIEAHGTGTKLGDPLEAQALREAFETINIKYKCNIGSSKPNVGHALVASGALSIAKAIYMFKHNKIIPQINFEILNSQIKLGNFNVSTTIESWPEEKTLIAINALGFSGTNAHLVLKKYAEKPKKVMPANPGFIYIFSSKTPQSLRRNLQSYLRLIKQLSETDLGNLSYSLNCKTSIFQYRFITYAHSKEFLLQNIIKFLTHSTADLTDRSAKEQTDYPRFMAAYNQSETDQLVKFCTPSGGLFECNSTQILLDNIYTADYQKITLPEYSFDKKSFWPEEKYHINTFTSNPESLQKENSSQKLLTAGQTETKTELNNILIQRLAELLDYTTDAIKDDVPLTEYGIDSLIALQLLSPFSSEIKLLSPNIVFDCKTINELSEKLYELKQQNAQKTYNEYKSDLLLPRHMSHIPIKRYILQENNTEIQWFNFGKATDKPLLLLPPLNTLAHVWVQQILYFTNNAYQIFIPHYPGHGSTNFYPVNLRELATTILKQASQFTTEEQLNIIGWSLGGCLSLHMLDIFPQNIAKLVLVSTAVKFENDIFSQSITLREELELKYHYLRALYQNDITPCINYISANASLDTLKHYYDSLQNFNVEKDLQKIKTPCLAFFGLKDPVITQKDTEPFKKISNIKIIHYAQQGHFIPLTTPLEFNKTVLSFIEER
jgi:phthiocerol/phenolphthiocerol synthesis type-I polyketide synthase A